VRVQKQAAADTTKEQVRSWCEVQTLVFCGMEGVLQLLLVCCSYSAVFQMWC
jgi:hypothetical protein